MVASFPGPAAALACGFLVTALAIAVLPARAAASARTSQLPRTE